MYRDISPTALVPIYRCNDIHTVVAPRPPRVDDSIRWSRGEAVRVLCDYYYNARFVYNGSLVRWVYNYIGRNYYCVIYNTRIIIY